MWPYEKKVEFVLLSSCLKMGIAGIHIDKTLSNQLYTLRWYGKEQVDHHIVSVLTILLCHEKNKMGTD